ncbi:MAG: hypothetical protein WCT99_02120 [Bacteroidota bacterium]|jgi:hypothetical protein
MKNFKKSLSFLLIVLLFGVFSCENPNSPTDTYSVSVSGTAFRKSSAPLDSVVVTLNNPLRKDTTKTDGTFNYTFTTSEANEVSTTLRLSRRDFFDTVFTVSYSATKKSIALGEIVMRGVTSAIDSIVTGKPSLRPGLITFVGSAYSTISIRGEGSVDATNLTFEVRDSLGVPVDEKNKTVVYFSLVSKPDNLTELNRTSTVTNSAGQVVVQLSSGQKSGLAQIKAYSLVKNAVDTTKIDTIKSQVVSVPIAGGLPVPTGFTIGSNKVNIPGGVKFNLRNTITAVVGDTFGNPVQQGTIVYFSTNGGLIQPTASTSADGTISVDLITGNPLPPNGIATVTAQVGTAGSSSSPQINGSKKVIVNEGLIIKNLRTNKSKTLKSDKSKIVSTAASSPIFTKTLTILFSGAPRISSTDSVFVVPGLGSKEIKFTVDDNNGNPLSEGTSISVTGVGFDTTGAVLLGDVNKILPDTDDKTYTHFSVSVVDKRTKNLNQSIPISLNFEVNGPNGNIKKVFTGVITSGASDSGKVGSIALVNPGIDTVVVNGLGSTTSKDIQVKVLDANNNPAPNIPVIFTLDKSIDGGEYLSSLIATTNNLGIATTTFHSGNRAGSVQISGKITSGEVSMLTDRKLIYVKTGPLATISFISQDKTELSVSGVGGEDNANIIFEGRDALGNPLDFANQTKLFFKIIGGSGNGEKILPDSTLTDLNTGRVSATLTSGNRSTVLQLIAQNFSGSIKSSPISMLIHGGFPYDSLFNFTNPLNSNTLEVEKTITQYPISMQLGDKYGNPVKPNTAVYFSTTAGIITTSNSFTGSDGNVSVSFTPVLDRLPGTITAKTVGEFGDTLTNVLSVSLKGGTSTTAREPAQIAFVGNTASNIYVSGVGATETSTLTYEVRDSLGTPIDFTKKAGVNFTMQFFPNAYVPGGTSPTFTPNVDSTDSQGKVNVTVISGTQAGVVQIVASLTTLTKTIVSQPTKISVYSGFADQNHFTIAAPNYNFPGLQRAFTPSLTVTVGIADKYSNPVAPGTQVYFNSSHGTITGGSPTDAGGFTTASLTPGNPYPNSPDTLLGMEPGYGRIYASTIGKDGTFISDSILILWTGAPVIVNTGVDTFTVGNGGSRGPFTFKVTDIYGHPLSAGTTISVVAGAGSVTGASATTLYDTFSTGEGVTTFTVYLNDDNNQETDPPVSTDLRVQVTHPVYGKYELILATGSVD